MSRRKQAKPRSLKREDGEEDLAEEKVILVENDGQENASKLVLKGSDENTNSSTDPSNTLVAVDNAIDDSMSDIAMTTVDDDDEEEEEEEEGQEYRCESCDSIFHSLNEFMDHRNFACAPDSCDESPLGLDDGTLSRSSTPLSSDAGKSPMAFHPSPFSPLSENADNDIPFSVGTDESHPYACQFCEKAFARLSHLKKHEQVHADLLPFKCNYCNRLFRHKRSRDRHVKLHTGDKKHKCPKCDTAFARSDHLKIHLKSHDNGKPFRCTICSRGYTNSAALTSHMLFHKKYNSTVNSKDFKCPHCTDMFTVGKDLQEHLQTHNNNDASPSKEKAVQCPQCNEVCLGQETLEIHLEQSHPKRYKCHVCPDAYSSNDELEHHLLTHSSAASAPQMNPLSLVVTPKSSSSEASSPTGAIKQDQPFAYSELVCEFCLKSGFSNKDVLDMHIQMVHAGKSKAPYLCPFCNAAYPTFYNLAEHVKILHEPLFMSSNPPYQCDFCSKEYKNLEDLKNHKEKVHKFGGMKSPGLTYLCPQCNMGFPDHGTLADHMHHNHQPLPLNMTNNYLKSPTGSETFNGGHNKRRRSSENSRLSPHPSHIPLDASEASADRNEEVVFCDKCDARFVNLALFKEHLKTHLNNIQNGNRMSPGAGSNAADTCKECGASFENEEQLETHVFMHYLSITTEYGCTSCLKLFSKPDELQKHLMDIHAHHLYRCALCKEIFDSKVNVQVHFAIKHSNECKLYKCTVCSSIFRSEMEWQLHVKVNHLCITKPYRCLFCKDSFSTEMELQCHLTEHKKQFPCPLCDEAFHVEYLLDKHVQSKHCPEQRESDPSTPEKQPNDLELSLLSFIKTDKSPSRQLSQEMYKCNACDTKFADDSMLMQHLIQVHQVTSLSPTSTSTLTESATIPKTEPGTSQQDKFSNVCVYCSQTFKTKGELERHMKIHAMPSSLKCNICDEVFPSSNILAEHKLIHCKVVQGNVCTICKFSLKNETQFYFHAEQHGFQGANMQCVICRQTLMSTVELNMHAKFHFQNSHSFYTCCVCLKSFNTKENLVAKLNSSGRAYYVCKPCYHGGEEVQTCTQCGKTFESKAELESHAAVHKVDPLPSTSMSENSNNRSPGLDSKAKAKPAKSFFTCCVCLKTFESQENLVPKLNASGRAYYVCKPCYHGGEPVDEHRCTWCSLSFDAKDQLEAHIKIHKKTYQCIKCQQSFSTEYEIQLHVATHMIQEGNTHECRLCGYVFDSPAKLQCHLIEHTFEEAELRCYVCDSLFRHPTSIQSHVLEHGIGARRYSCSQCNQRFFFSAELQNHLYGHGGIKMENGTDFKCPDCHKVFANIMNLNNHRQTHEKKELHFKCTACPEAFETMSDLQQHFFNMHTSMDLTKASKPYKCVECEKEFTTMNNLQSHMKIHSSGKENRKLSLKSNSSVKPYTCSICSKIFSRKSHLKDHVKVHYNQPSLYRCMICDEGFPQARLLTHHMTTIHKEHHPEAESQGMTHSLAGSLDDSLGSSECSPLGHSGDSDCDEGRNGQQNGDNINGENLIVVDEKDTDIEMKDVMEEVESTVLTKDVVLSRDGMKSPERMDSRTAIPIEGN